MVAVLTMTINSLSSSTSISCSVCRVLIHPPARFSAAADSTASFHRQKQLLFLMALQSLTHKQIPQCTSSSTGNTPASVVADIDTKLLSLFHQIGINDREAELLLENYPSLRSIPFDSVRARIQSLQHLGINDLTLCLLISKRPDLLTAEEVDSLIWFVRDDLESKIEPAQLEHLFSSTEPRFLVGFVGKVRLLLRLGIPQEEVAHILNNVNLTKALCLKSAEEIERTIAFFNPFGGLNLIVRRPALLNFDLERQLSPRIGFLSELSGGDDDATGTVLRRLPAILTYTVEHCTDHVDFLRSFAQLTDQEIFRIIVVYPNLFSASRKRKLLPRIDFLKQCGLSSNEIFRFLIKAPTFLSLSFEENLANKLTILVKIGYENRTKDLAMAMGAVTRTSCKNLQEVIGLFLNYGLSCNDILGMSKKHPQVLQYKHESLEEKMDYLIEEMGREVGELLAFPAFLGYNLDSRIKHRYEAKRKIMGEGMSLNKLLSESTERFSMKMDKKGSTSVLSLTDK